MEQAIMMSLLFLETETPIGEWKGKVISYQLMLAGLSIISEYFQEIWDNIYDIVKKILNTFFFLITAICTQCHYYYYYCFLNETKSTFHPFLMSYCHWWQTA